MSERIPEEGARRGRRSRELEQVLSEEIGVEDNEDMDRDRGIDILNTGDSVMCRISLEHPTAAGQGWFSWGATTTVRPGESEEDAAERLYEAVTTRAYELIDGVTDTVEEAVEQTKSDRRTRRITTR